LFQKFKVAGIKDYLNKKSLNQAGYEVEIENYNEMDNAIVVEYFYAFDKADWTTKKYFDTDKLLNYNKITETSNGTAQIIKKKVHLDYVTIEAYKQKLISNNKNIATEGLLYYQITKPQKQI
jgi:hypothetical protein